MALSPLGPVSLLVQSAQSFGWVWDPEEEAFNRPGLPLLPILAAPLQHYQAAVKDAARTLVLARLPCRSDYLGADTVDLPATSCGLRYGHLPRKEAAITSRFMAGSLWCATKPFRQGLAPDNLCPLCGEVDDPQNPMYHCVHPPLLLLGPSPFYAEIFSQDISDWAHLPACPGYCPRPCPF